VEKGGTLKGGSQAPAALDQPKTGGTSGVGVGGSHIPPKNSGPRGKKKKKRETFRDQVTKQGGVKGRGVWVDGRGSGAKEKLVSKGGVGDGCT